MLTKKSPLQGIALSSILYIVYVVELGSLWLNGKIYSYADHHEIIINSDTNQESVWPYLIFGLEVQI